MNVLFFSELFYPHGGGAELATFLYAKSLSEKGFNVVVITNRFREETQVSIENKLVIYRLPLFEGMEGVKYSVLSRVDVLFSSFLKRSVKWADVVYVPRFWFSAIPLAKAYRRPVVAHLHDYIPICSLSNLYDVSENTVCRQRRTHCRARCIYAYERTGKKGLRAVLESVLLNSTVGWSFGKMLELSDAIVCVSRAQKSLIISNKKSLSSKIRVIYNPLPDLSPANVQDGDFGYFGGPSYMKGFHVLYKAVTYITHRKHEKLKIHATKFSDFESFHQSLRGIGIFTYAKLGSKDYDRLYSQIRTVVVPSVWEEPLPYVVTEAMLSGRLLIASNIGGIPEQVTGCDGAFLFDAGEYEQLADKMLYVKHLGKDDLIDLVVKNRESVLKNFDNDKILDDFVNVLTTVAS